MILIFPRVQLGPMPSGVGPFYFVYTAAHDVYCDSRAEG